MLADLVQAVAANALHPVVDRTFGFGEAREVFEFVAKSSHVGKVVIRHA